MLRTVDVITEPILYTIAVITLLFLFYDIRPSKKTYYFLFIWHFAAIALLLLISAEWQPCITLFAPIISIFLIAFCNKGIFIKTSGCYLFFFLLNLFSSFSLYSLISKSEFTEYLIELIFAAGYTLLLMIAAARVPMRERIRTTVSFLPRRIKGLVLLALSCCSLFFVFILSCEQYMENVPRVIVLRISLFLLVIVLGITYPAVITFSLSNRYLRESNEAFQKNMEEQVTHYRALSEYSYELRRFRHDMKNIGIGIRRAIDCGNTKEVIRILDDCEENFLDPKTHGLLFSTGCDIANALLDEKARSLSETPIKIAFEGIIPENLFPAADLCILLGNAMDNAVEACQKITGDEKREITIACRRYGDVFFLRVRNPIGAPVNLKNGEIVSNKSNRSEHGFGLYSIRTVAKKYHGTVKTAFTDQIFTLDVELTVPAAENIQTEAVL